MGRKCDTTRRHDDVGGGKAAPGRRKGGHDANWADANLSGPKNKENPSDRSNCYK
jgi:hypothetical protein